MEMLKDFELDVQNDQDNGATVNGGNYFTLSARCETCFCPTED